MSAMDRDRAAVRAQDRAEKVDRHVAKIVEHAEAMGWVVETTPIPLADPDVEHAIGVGAMKRDEHPDNPEDGVDWLFTTAIAVRRSTGRVITLQDVDRGDGRVIVEADGFGRYWRGGAYAWEAALADPQAWCGGWWPTPEEATSARVNARVRKVLDR